MTIDFVFGNFISCAVRLKGLVSGKKLMLMAAFLPLFLALTVSAQTYQVTGKITDDKGEPLRGASISIKSSSKGALSDAEGSYHLDVPAGKAVLVFSFSGFSSQEIEVSAQQLLNVQLTTEAKSLNDVVVVGYGTQRKGEVTSAIASVKSGDFVKGGVRDAGQLIQGKVAGLSVSTSSGDPNAGTEIQLRGISSLKASSEPLVLIDGIPGTLSSVVPEDIESIDVLKDGSAAAIYGTRGTNGVMLITTKKTTSRSPARVTYSGYASIQTIARTLRFLTADEYRQQISNGIGFTDYGTSTDWVDEISRTPVSQNHNLSVQGGNGKTNYNASINYRDWQGLFLRSDNQQISGRASINHSMWDDKVKFNMNFITRSKTFWDGGRGRQVTAVPLKLFGFYPTIYRDAMIRNPTDSVRDSHGEWMERPNNDNPVSYLNETNGENTDKEIRLNGSVTLTPIKNLNIKLLLSSVQFVEQRGFAETKKNKSTLKDGLNGYAYSGTSDYKDKLMEFTTDYSRSFGAHQLTVLGGYSYQDKKSEEFSMQNWDFPTDLYSYYRMETGNALGRGEAKMYSFATSYKLIGFFGRLNYSYLGKYMAMLSVRQEGSSKFGANHKWGTFPALSLGWRISKESFMDNVSFVNNLKLRAGYGVTGIAPDASYLSLTSLNYGDRFLYNGEWIQSLSPVRNPNPDLRWEKKEEFNIGLDFTLFKDRINGSLDVYQRKTNDMLWDYQVPVPPFLYSSMLANVGSMKNNGLEVLVNYSAVKSGDFQWNTGINFSTNSNKLISLSNDLFQTTNDFFDVGDTGPPVQSTTHRVQIGKPIGNFYGYKSIDIDDQGKWIIEGADGKPKPLIDAKAEDKQVLGNGLPKYYAGWNNNFKYKNWNLDVLMRGAFGFQILNFSRMVYENVQSVQSNVLKSAFDDVYGKGRSKNAPAFVSYYIEDGDYLKLDNVTLGYNFPVARNKYVNNAYLYASALNMFTISGYKGLDPEVSRSGLTPGNDDQYKYPTTRTFTIGFNITFN